MVEISFIVPVYNTPMVKLKECLESIMKIDFMKYEIIFIDDGSTKEYNLLYKKYLESINFPFIVSVQQDNGGVSVARNVGLSLAKGKYIMFVDSDDSINSDALRSSFNSDIVFFDYEMIKGRKKGSILSAVENRQGTVTQQNLAWSILQGKLRACRYLYKRSFLLDNRICFPKGVIQGEDAEFNFQCMLKRPSIQYVRKTLYCYHYSSTAMLSRWKRYADKIIIDDDARFKKFIDVLPKCFPDDHSWKRNYLLAQRIEEIYTSGISLCCVNQIKAHNRRMLEKLMWEIDVPENADKRIRTFCLDIRNQKWIKIYVVSLIVRAYWLLLRI